MYKNASAGIGPLSNSRWDAEGGDAGSSRPTAALAVLAQMRREAALFCGLGPWILFPPLRVFGLFLSQQFVKHGDLPGVGFSGQEFFVVGDIRFIDELGHGSPPSFLGVRRNQDDKLGLGWRVTFANQDTANFRPGHRIEAALFVQRFRPDYRKLLVQKF